MNNSTVCKPIVLFRERSVVGFDFVGAPIELHVRHSFKVQPNVSQVREPLCLYGHHWEKLGHSLRYFKNSGGCYLCTAAKKMRDKDSGALAESKRKHYFKKHEHYLQKSRENYRKNPEMVERWRNNARHKVDARRMEVRKGEKNLVEDAPTPCVKCGTSKFYYINGGCVECSRVENKRWRVENPDKERFRTKRYRLNNRDKGRANEARRKARKLSTVSALFDTKTFSAHLKSFNGTCVYCGNKTDKPHADHFIPLSKGGHHSIFNVVLACPSCNQNKTNKDPRDWYFSKPFATKAKWRLILRRLGKSEDSYAQPPLF